MKKAKQVGGKAQATRNEFTNLATGIVQAFRNAEAATKPQMQLVLEAAEKTHNREQDREKFRDALMAAYTKDGCPKLTARVYVSEAIRICKAYFVTRVMLVDGETKPRKVSGKELMQGVGYKAALKRASAILKATGKQSKRGRKASVLKGKANIIDALDKVIAAVRVTAGIDASVLKGLVQARSRMVGKTNNVPDVPENFDSLSRGQKAKFTRARNAALSGATVH